MTDMQDAPDVLSLTSLGIWELLRPLRLRRSAQRMQYAPTILSTVQTEAKATLIERVCLG